MWQVGFTKIAITGLRHKCDIWAPRPVAMQFVWHKVIYQVWKGYDLRFSSAFLSSRFVLCECFLVGLCLCLNILKARLFTRLIRTHNQELILDISLTFFWKLVSTARCSIPNPTLRYSIQSHPIRDWQSHPLIAPRCYIHLGWHFYRTQVSLGSDLWVLMSVRPSLQDLLLI